jgi:diacylglycerol kinase (ATP)
MTVTDKRVHVQLVTNADAGNYKPAKINALRDAFARAGATTTVSLVGPGKQLLIEDVANLLCVAGGDGTLRHVAKSVIDAKRTIPIAAYPMGTVNLLQRETGAPSDPDAFVAYALKPQAPMVHHPVTLNETLFLGCASVGPDALSVANLSSPLKRMIGRAAYGVSLARLLPGWPRPQLTVTTDGKVHKCEAIYIAKGKFFAGSWSFAPEAKRTTAKLHVIMLRDASRRSYAEFIRNTMRGEPLKGRDNLITVTCTSLRIEGDEAWPVQADGDDAGILPAKINICSDVIRVI